MTNPEQFDLEANKYWFLDQLVDALSTAKGKKLTKLEKTHLSAALIKVAQKKLAEQTFQALESLRISLARGLYSYVKSLLGIDSKKRVYWHELPELLTKAGYKRPQANEALQIWESLSSPSRDMYAQDLIDTVEDKLVKIKINGEKCSFPEALAIASEELGDKAEEQGDYSKAIACYRVPLEQDPILYNRFLVKIAACLNEMELYADLVPLTLFALKQVSDNDSKSRLNGYLGSAFSEIALKTLDETILQESLDYYERSKDRSWGFNVYAPWNRFELRYKFSQEKKEQYKKHLRAAKLDFADFINLAFIDFEKFVVNPKSNFNKCKKTIICKAKKIKENVQDSWLIEQLDYLISLKH